MVSDARGVEWRRLRRDLGDDDSVREIEEQVRVTAHRERLEWSTVNARISAT
jgi:hypothetical protein